MDTVGRYWVEILGAVLIFASSFVTERFIPKQYRYIGWVVFGILAFGYGVLAIAVDRATFLRAQHDHQEITDENKTLNSNMTTALGMLNTDTNQLTSLNLEMAAMRVQLNDHDPKLMAQLSAKLKRTQEEGERLTKANLLAMTPIVADQIESIGGAWYGLADNQTLSLQEITDYRPDTPENRAKAEKINNQIAATDAVYQPKMRVLFQQANYLQDAILKLIPESQHTKEDKDWEGIFKAEPLRRIAPADEVAYLRNLAKRLAEVK